MATTAKRNARMKALMGKMTMPHGTCTQRRSPYLVSWRTANSARSDLLSQHTVKQAQMADSFALNVQGNRKIKRKKIKSQENRL